MVEMSNLLEISHPNDGSTVRIGSRLQYLMHLGIKVAATRSYVALGFVEELVPDLFVALLYDQDAAPLKVGLIRFCQRGVLLERSDLLEMLCES